MWVPSLSGLAPTNAFVKVASGPGAIVTAMSKVQRSDPVILLYVIRHLHRIILMTGQRRDRQGWARIISG